MSRPEHPAYAWFRALPRAEQVAHLRSVTELCIDAAPTSLARKLEILLEQLEQEGTL